MWPNINHSAGSMLKDHEWKKGIVLSDGIGDLLEEMSSEQNFEQKFVK